MDTGNITLRRRLACYSSTAKDSALQTTPVSWVRYDESATLKRCRARVIRQYADGMVIHLALPQIRGRLLMLSAHMRVHHNIVDGLYMYLNVPGVNLSGAEESCVPALRMRSVGALATDGIYAK